MHGSFMSMNFFQDSPLPVPVLEKEAGARNFGMGQRDLEVAEIKPWPCVSQFPAFISTLH